MSLHLGDRSTILTRRKGGSLGRPHSLKFSSPPWGKGFQETVQEGRLM